MLVFLLSCTFIPVIHAEELTTSKNNEDIIAVVDPYIKLIDNKLNIINENELLNNIGIKNFTKVKESIEISNNLIKNKEIIIEKSKKNRYKSYRLLSSKGGNVNRMEYFWWGMRRYADHEESAFIAKQFINDGKGLVNVSSFISTLGGKIKFLSYFNLGSNVGSYIREMGEAIKSKNGKYGTIIDLNYTLIGYKVKSQTSRTK